MGNFAESCCDVLLGEGDHVSVWCFVEVEVSLGEVKGKGGVGDVYW